MDEPPISEYTLLPIEIGEEFALTLLPIYSPCVEGFVILTLLPAKNNRALFSVAAVDTTVLLVPTMVTVLPVFALLYRPNRFTAAPSSFTPSVSALFPTPTMIGNVSFWLLSFPAAVLLDPQTNWRKR
ncbi:hypothetical protein [Haemophilus influenzae]|uniref:hypothetical protein n=1 Tax=Haemophilus influenzae TaxID=727 RepID=UPI003D805366